MRRQKMRNKEHKYKYKVNVDASKTNKVNTHTLTDINTLLESLGISFKQSNNLVFGDYPITEDERNLFLLTYNGKAKLYRL